MNQKYNIYPLGILILLINEKVDFKRMCLQDGPSGVLFDNGTDISWQGSLNNVRL